MTGYFISLVMGLAVGVAYGLDQVRSPAPPVIALVGLFGCLIGEVTVDWTRRHLAPQAEVSVRPPHHSPSLPEPTAATRTSM